MFFHPWWHLSPKFLISKYREIEPCRKSLSSFFLLPYGLFVVCEGLIEFSLLLQDGCEVGVGGRELREDLQGLEVEPRRILDVALLALDVGQVVQGIRVGRGESEKNNDKN